MRLEGTGHKFVFEYGTSFPKNPKIGSVFCRTDIENTHFQYDGRQWIALAKDARMSYEAPTNQSRPDNPVTAEAILAASNSSIVMGPDGTIQGVVGQDAPQDAIDAATLLEHLSGAETSVDLSLILDKIRVGPDAGKVHEQQTPDRSDWVDGVFVPGGNRKVAYAPTDVIPVVQKEMFDLDGNFVRRDSCYQLETNRQGIFIEGSAEYTSPYTDCDCTMAGGCPVVPWFTVTSRETDPLAGLNSFRLRWGRPEGFAESLYEYRIEAVQYPKDFTGSEFTENLWSGTCALTDTAHCVSIVDGPLMSVDQYKGKILYIVTNDGGCKKAHIIEGNSERTFYLNIPVSTLFWRPIEYCEVWEPYWENVDYFTTFPIVTAEGAVYADRYAESYEMDVPAMQTSMWFRITALNWWGEGPYTYTDDFIPINPCPYDITWVTAYGELGTIYAKVTGLAPNDVTVDGFELCYSSETDENPETALVGPLSGECYVLWSQAGTWAIGVNKPVYLYARSILGDCYSDWVGYGEIPDGADLETTLIDDNLQSYANLTACSYMQYRGPTPGTACKCVYRKFAGVDNGWIGFWIEKTSAQHYGFVNGVTYSGATGVRITAAIDERIGGAITSPTFLGFFIGSTDELSTGNTYFIGLESRRLVSAYPITYAVLYRCVDRVPTEELSRSVELGSAGYDLNPGDPGVNTFNLIIECRSGRFSIIANDDEVLNVEDDTLVLSGSSYYLGWTFYGNTSYGTYFIGHQSGVDGYDNFKVERINYLGRVALVDPGLAVDTLRDEYTPEITYPFPVTEHIRLHTTNASGDYIRLELDDNRQPYIEVYNDYYNYIEDIGLVTEGELNLDSLDDVSILNPSDYQTLMYIGTQWVNISDDDFNYHNELKITPYDAKVSVSETNILMGNLDSSHYTPVTFVNANTYIASGCQVCVVFNTSTPIISGFLNSNGGDLRVYSENGEYLPFWWQPETWNTTTTKLWVRVSEIPAAGSLRCFITYGKSDMTTPMANGESVFEFFDDFTKYDVGSSIDGQYGWNVDSLSPTQGTANIALVGSTKCLRLSGLGVHTIVSHPFDYDKDAYALYSRMYQRNCRIGFSSEGSEISLLGIPEEGMFVYNAGLGIGYNHYDADTVRYTANCSPNFLYGNYWFDQSMKRCNGVATVHTFADYVTGYTKDHTTVLSDPYTSVSGITDIFISNFSPAAAPFNLDYLFITKAYTTDISYILGSDTSNTIVNIVDIDLSTYDVKLEQGLLSFAAIPDTPTAVTGYGKIFTNGDTLYFLDQAGNLYNLLEGTGTSTNTGCAGFDQYIISAVSGTFVYSVPTGAASGAVVALNGQLWTEGETYDYVIAGMTLTVSSGVTLYTGDRITVYYPICLSDSGGGGTSSNADTLDGYDSSYFAVASHDHDSSYSPLGHTHTDIDAITLDGLDSTDFALAGHTHVNVDAITLSGIAASGFSLSGHTHAYSPLSHTHAGTDITSIVPSATNADMVDGLHGSAFSLTGHTHVNVDATTLSGIAASGFALAGHTHASSGDADTLDGYHADAFALSGHVHINIDATTLSGVAASGFALSDHLHSQYALSSHSHSEYALTAHTHVNVDATTLSGIAASGFALSDHTHLGSGTDADTLDGYHADAFALSGHVHVNIDAVTLSGIAASGFALATHVHEGSSSATGVTKIVAGTGISLQSTGGDGTGEVTISCSCATGGTSSGDCTVIGVSGLAYYWDSDTKLLLHFNGDNNVTTSGMVDESMYSHLPTPFGNARISTDQSKFGESSLYVDGTGDYVLYPMDGSWDTGNSDFTIECFARLGTDINTSISDNRQIFGKGLVEAVDGTWCVGVGHEATWGSNVRFNISWRVASSYGSVTSSEIACVKDTWYHFAVVRKNNYIYLYFEGNLVGSGACTARFTTYNAYPPVFTVGTRLNNSWTGASYFLGYIDEVRFSTVARYTANFTPPIEEFSPYIPVETTINLVDADTLDGIPASGFASENHTHINVDATTLSGIPASGFAAYEHSHVEYATVDHTHPSGYNVIYQKYMNTTDAFSVVISGTPCEFLELELHGGFTNVGGNDGIFLVRLNNDSGNNYNLITHVAYSGAGANHTYSLTSPASYITVCRGFGGGTYSNQLYVLGTFALRAGLRRFFRAFNSVYSSGPYYAVGDNVYGWTNTADNVVTLDFSWLNSPSSINCYLVLRQKPR